MARCTAIKILATLLGIRLGPAEVAGFDVAKAI